MYIEKMVQVDFPENQYFKQEFHKSQICIHHTVSPRDNARSVASWWLSNESRVATQIIIQGDGVPFQCFSSKYWGYHLGVDNADLKAVKLSKYTRLDYNCIGVEICGWGGLVQDKDKKWYPGLWDDKKKKMVPNTKIKAIDDVQEYPKGFRGFYGYQKYTQEQINCLKELLLYWNSYWKIPLDYNEDMWDITPRAISGTPGIWTHVSYRIPSAKSDCHPQPELITMLKGLKL